MPKQPNGVTKTPAKDAEGNLVGCPKCNSLEKMGGNIGKTIESVSDGCAQKKIVDIKL